MDLSTQREILDRLNHNYDANSETLADSDMFHRATTYSDPDYLAAEQTVLRQNPVIIGHSSSLPNAGDFLTDRSLGLPILLSRQTDGSLKALLNICRHRGSPVCLEKSGNAKIFVCPYHAWSYRSDGSLLRAPSVAFPSVEGEVGSMVELPVEERHGLIWVVGTPGATIDVAAHLGPEIDADFSSFGLGDLVLERDAVLTEDLNWKYILDGFLEVYHIPKLHTLSIAPYIHGKYSLFDRFGPHGRLVAARKSLDPIRREVEQGPDFMKHVAVNYQLFPNTIIVWQGDHFEIWTSYPDGDPSRCTVRVQSLTTRAMAAPEYKARWDRNWDILIGTVVSEDWAISKTVQSGIPYLTEDRVILGRNEPGMQHFHGMLDRAVSDLKAA
ncbi:aromatic ring-hydroxylating dioxygenase subunit alpha [Sphingomonas sp. AOB5]|uniref:aromatic ring-hydroxylating oxygenase subunit alpha n=1 Tax=Sphingomonas sp. AOB5 TaxID=3034017 RepID=UPI0023F8F50C|nr:aromatic ring-hydroxylating dioxygenase subunit alpha [Sphingomonas sp. AOB5]MDF7774812.1 aromatic ring-hydroxylating dioxygenase subunit alpha [Sphingomonas sp. AOB5]